MRNIGLLENPDSSLASRDCVTSVPKELPRPDVAFQRSDELQRKRPLRSESAKLTQSPGTSRAQVPITNIAYSFFVGSAFSFYSQELYKGGACEALPYVIRGRWLCSVTTEVSISHVEQRLPFLDKTLL